ncbi:MAG: ABC transporter permease [Vicinamibacterales bacterium]
MRRIGFLIWKELIELGQDPRLFGIVVIAPIVQLFMLAYAATTDVRDVPIVIADADRSDASRELISRFDASPSFTLTGIVNGPDEIDPLLERGDAWLALIVPRGYGAALTEGGASAVQIVADGSDANSAGLSLSYATNLIASYGQDLSLRAAAARGGHATTPSIQPVVRVWFNPRLESRDFMIPGIVAILLLVVTTNLSSMGIVREKELGTLEQLNVTPLTRTELIVGKLVPYGLVGLIDVVLVLSVAILWFHVPMRGSYVLLFALTLVYLVSTLALGLLVSTISQTQQQAMMTTTFFFLIPMMLLSGFVFPIENMPAAIQPITYLIPVRYFLVILRSIFLKGVGLDVLWPQALALSAWGVAVLLLAIARSTKRAA